jgi:hypothetical protein
MCIPDPGGRPDDREGLLPGLPPAGQDHPQGPVPAGEARTSIPEGTGEHADLVAERRVLHRELMLRPKG